MKNPYVITLSDSSHVEIGDPYILRFNGKYYLYCSTCDEEEGIRCFTSDDLVTFTYYGLVAQGLLLKHAYAPEVILYNDEFYMATSPYGNGHYFLKSKSPLGPFKFITQNLHNMIDGSFVLDGNNDLHFLRADHNGIAYLDYKNNTLCNRKDILPQISRAWTEGPSVTYFNKRYYVTYCGNDVLSPSYRVKIASSLYLDKDYTVNPTPLLLSTKKGFSGFGHNSVVLGPSLDEYFVAYHKLDWTSPNSTTRYLCLNRLYFNKKECSCNNSDFEVRNPKRPDFECDVKENNLLESLNDKLLTKSNTSLRYTAEFNFKGYTDVIIGYIDEFNYSIISLNKKIEIYDVSFGIKKLRKSITTKFDFNHFHSLRIINDKKCEILIDNVFVLETAKFNKGRCGYFFREDGLHYTAYINSVYTESMKYVEHIIPGKIEANYTETKLSLKEYDDAYALSLKKNDSVTYKLVGKNKDIFKLFARMINSNCSLEISTNTTYKIVNIKANESEYLFNLRYLSDIQLDSNDTLTIKVLSGKFEFQYLKFDEVIECIDKITSNMLDENGEYYLFTNYHNTQKLDFKISVTNEDNLFGLILNATNYTNWHTNKTFTYLGYFVGFDNNLLVIDYCQYDRTRIYDKPYRLLPNKVYNLKVTLKDNMIYVYVNGNLEIFTTLKYDQGYGLNGVYKSKHSNVKILDYEGGRN